ncbi:hypothetical protein BDL97_01G088700 [Sphagnum fallax]|nr:hypothetical protein BDL97_01G088700 [Sphagnum fallax]
MAPESRVVSVLGLRVVGGKLCSTLSTFFNLSLLLCCRPNLIAVVVVTEIRSSISSQAPQIISTTRTSQRVKDSIQLRDSIRTLRLWI